LGAFAEGHAISDTWKAELDTVIEGTHFQPAETVFGTWPFERPRASKVAKKGERVQPVERMPNMKLPNEPTDLPKEQADRVPARSKMVIPYPPSRPAVRHFDYGTHPWNSKYWKSEDESKFPVLQGQTIRTWGDPAADARPPLSPGRVCTGVLLHSRYHVPERNNTAGSTAEIGFHSGVRSRLIRSPNGIFEDWRGPITAWDGGAGMPGVPGGSNSLN
jgi:hypothetical protein